MPTSSSPMTLTRLLTVCGVAFAVLQVWSLLRMQQQQGAADSRPRQPTLRRPPSRPAPESPARAFLLAAASEDESRIRVAHLQKFVNAIHSALGPIRPPGFGVRNDKHRATDAAVWKIYSGAVSRLFATSEYADLKRSTMSLRRDSSIFVSISSFRDEVCPDTLDNLFATAADPWNVAVGLVQQNCDQDQHDHYGCWSAVMPEDMQVHPIGPDIDCARAYCARDTAHPAACGENSASLRVLRFNESQTFGPVFGRYLGSMLWQGENYYMQVDAHTTFARGWDAVLLEDYAIAPSEKPIFSHYPPAGPQKPVLPPPGKRHKWEFSPGPCMCTASFAEYNIVRIGTQDRFPFKEHHPAGCTPKSADDKSESQSCLRVPRHAPFVGAGFVFANANFILEVPFDPYLPFVFMGEELDFSTRVWTAGWDIFCPPRSVVAHAYVRPQKPKFWGALQRSIGLGAHNSLQRYVLARVKHLVEYPEDKELEDPSLAIELDVFGLGDKRKLSGYLENADLDFTTKAHAVSKWCKLGDPPPNL